MVKVAEKLSLRVRGPKQVFVVVGVLNLMDINLMLVEICLVLTCLNMFLLANVCTMSSRLIGLWLYSLNQSVL